MAVQQSQAIEPEHVETVAAVRATDLTLGYDAKIVLRGIDLTVPAGQTVALMGPNGAGKSTLLQVLATLSRPQGGRLELFGIDACTLAAAKVRARIGLISHQPILYRGLSARENLEFFAKLYDVPDPAGRATEMLAMVALTRRADDPVGTFSRGMVQRVSIARAMVHDPDLLLADEPFSGLDVASVATLQGLLVALGRQGKTIVMTNHDIGQSLAAAQRAVVLHRGKVAMDASTDQLTEADVLKEMAES